MSPRKNNLHLPLFADTPDVDRSSHPPGLTGCHITQRSKRFEDLRQCVSGSNSLVILCRVASLIQPHSRGHHIEGRARYIPQESIFSSPAPGSHLLTDVLTVPNRNHNNLWSIRWISIYSLRCHGMASRALQAFCQRIYPYRDDAPGRTSTRLFRSFVRSFARSLVRQRRGPHVRPVSV